MNFGNLTSLLNVGVVEVIENGDVGATDGALSP